MNLAKLFITGLSLIFITNISLAFQPEQGDQLSGDFLLHRDTLIARQFLDKGEGFVEAGSYTKAMNVLEQAQVLYANHMLWQEAVACVLWLSELADNFETAELKIKYSNLALHLTQTHIPDDHLNLASAYRQKAESLMMTEDLDSANYYLALAIPIFNKHEAWPDLGWSEILIGVNFLNQYQLDSSSVHLEKVQVLLKNEELPDDQRADLESTVINLLGVLYNFQGDINKAIRNTCQALELDLNKTRLTDLDSSFIADHFNNLGAFYLTKGDFQRALDNFIQSLNFYNNASKDATLLNNIGELYIRQQKYQNAVNYFQKSLNVSKGKNENLEARINALNGLALAFRGLKQYEKALKFCGEAMNVPIDYRRYMTLGIIGSIQILQQQAPQAIEKLNLAIETYDEDPNASLTGAFYNSRLFDLIGDAYILLQDYTTALKFYQKALVANHATFREIDHFEMNPGLTGIYEPVYFLRTLQSKAKAISSASQDVSQLQASLSTYQLTIQWIDSLQTSYFSEDSQLDWSAEFKQIYEEAIWVSFRLYKQTQEFKYLDYAFTFSEKSKNAILLEALKTTEGKAYGGVPDSLIQREKDLNLDIAFYQKAMYNAGQQEEEAKLKLYQQYLSVTRLQLINLKEQLEKDFPKFYEFKYNGKQATIGLVQSGLIDEETTLLEYFVGDSSAFVFIITRRSALLLQLETPLKLNSQVDEFRKVLLDFNAFQQNAKLAYNNYQENAFPLFNSILKTPLESLPQDINKLIFVPDGFLNTIPFEALIIEKKAKGDFDFASLSYLLYDFQVQYAYSADLLLKNKNRQKELPLNTQCLALAPNYKSKEKVNVQGNLQQLGDTRVLEGTAREVQQISPFFDGIYDTESTANEKQFKALAGQFGILHLAMHGVADFENANDSYLRFSDIDEDTLEDNLLFHYEIANMDLNAQLVVLSACETGTGKYAKGEGVYSLARSFMYAGVPSVVMSLWKVSDESTSRLMPYFYENLAKGHSKVAALREAKLRFLKEANLEYRHPFFWSAFVVLGEAQKINKAGSNYLWWGIIILCIGLSGLWFYKRKTS